VNGTPSATKVQISDLEDSVILGPENTSPTVFAATKCGGAPSRGPAQDKVHHQTFSPLQLSLYMSS
jgi:hypothetical protein